MTGCELCHHRVGNVCYGQFWNYDMKAKKNEVLNTEPRQLTDITVMPEWCHGENNPKGDFVHPVAAQCRDCACFWPMSGESNGGPGMMGGGRHNSCGAYRIFPTEDTDRACPFRDEKNPYCENRFQEYSASGPAVDPELVDIILAGLNDGDLTFWYRDGCTYNSFGTITGRSFQLRYKGPHSVSFHSWKNLGKKQIRLVEVGGLGWAWVDGEILHLSDTDKNRCGSTRIAIPIVGSTFKDEEPEEEEDDFCPEEPAEEKRAGYKQLSIYDLEEEKK